MTREHYTDQDTPRWRLNANAVQRPDRKRVRLRNVNNPSPEDDAGGGTLLDEQPPADSCRSSREHLPEPAPPLSRGRTACSGARFSELKRAFGDDVANGNWWDRRSGAGLEYLSGRSIESFPLLRPLPELPLAEPSGDVLQVLMRTFEPELVKRLPNGITCNVAACIDAERAGRGASNHASTAYLCGHVDNFCQKSVCFLLPLHVPPHAGCCVRCSHPSQPAFVVALTDMQCYSWSIGTFSSQY